LRIIYVTALVTALAALGSWRHWGQISTYDIDIPLSMR
jgi:hypothetical protein